MTVSAETLASDAITGRMDDSQKAKAWVLILVLATFGEISTLQYVMVSPAALKIAPSFPGVGANISWMTTIFGLVGAIAVPLIGKSSDLWGKKKMLLLSGVVFIIGSVICAVTGSWALFLVGRAFQALAIGNNTVLYGLFRDLLPRKYIPIALGVAATGFGLSAIVAPMLSGYLADNHGWRAIFWFLTVYGVVVLAMVMAVTPETKLRVKQRLDVLGALILVGGVALCLVYVSNGNSWGWGRPSAWAYLVAGLILLAIFIPVERAAKEPIMDIPLLLSPKVLLTLAVTACGSLVVGILAYALPLMLQTPTAAQLVQNVYAQTAAQMHMPAAQVGAFLHVDFNDALKYAAGLGLVGYALHAALYQGSLGMVAGPAAGWWSSKRSFRLPMIITFVTFVAAAALLITTSTHGVWFYALSAGVFGIGYGALFAWSPSLMMDAVPPRQQGISGGMLAVAISLGTAVSTAIVAAIIDANPLMMTVSAGGKVQQTVNLAKEGSLTTWTGFQDVLWVVGVAAVVGLALVLVMRHGRTAATGGAITEEDPAMHQELAVAGEA